MYQSTHLAVGRRRPFSEGLGLVLLKRLSDAIRDNDSIYCVIRDVLSNHDGHYNKISYSTPSSDGQYQLLKEIYTRQQIDLSKVLYIEGHGTGTQVGDPIEANTLGKFFNRSKADMPLLLGSVKSNIGHTEGTSGIAGLIKVALSIKHRVIPPQMNFKKINPKIKAQEYNLHIVQHLTRIPTNYIITIGINSFGLGGNNCHAIIEEYSKPLINKKPTVPFKENFNKIDAASQQYFTAVLSAKSSESIRNQVDNFFKWYTALNMSELLLTNICYKLLAKRDNKYAHRVSFNFADENELKSQLNSLLLAYKVNNTTENNSISGVTISQFDESRSHLRQNICFVYPGQGTQWWKMGRQLYFSEAIFKHWIDKINSELLELTSEWSLLQELIYVPEEKFSRINETNIAQPALFAIQVALTALWLSWGIEPKTIVGHSGGEVAAVYISGRLTLQEAVQTIYYRSDLQHRTSRQNGRMLAVTGLNEVEANMLLQGFKNCISLAAINGPNSLTFSGDGTQLENLYEILTELKPNTFKKWLNVENAYHSQQMEKFNISEDLLSSLANIGGKSLSKKEDLFNETCSKAHLFSTVTGKCADNLHFTNQYWWKNLRDTVRFKEAILAILNDHSIMMDVFLEISPHPVLVTSIQECFTLLNLNTFPLTLYSLKRKENEQQTMLSSLSQLQSVDWKVFCSTRTWSAAASDEGIDDLPFYAFEKQTCWLETRDSVVRRRAKQQKHHPLLGLRMWPDEKFAVWKNYINLNVLEHAYLTDHIIQGQPLFPLTGFIELILAAMNELQEFVQPSLTPINEIVLENIQLLSSLSLNKDPDQYTEIHTVIIQCQQFFIYSRRNPVLNVTRLGGIASYDLVEDFSKEQLLNDYSSHGWILHAEGFINTKSIGCSTMLDTLCNVQMLQKTFPNLLYSSFKNINKINLLYQYLANRGYLYGPVFQCVGAFHICENESYSRLNISDRLSHEHLKDYYLHPALGDACFHSTIGCIPGYDTYVPVRVKRLIIRNNKMLLNKQTIVHASIRKNARHMRNELSYDLMVLDAENNRMVAIWEGLQVKQLFERSDNIDIDFYLFDKVRETSILPKTVSTNKHILTHKLIKNYCFEMHWKQIPVVRNIDKLIPECSELLYTQGNFENMVLSVRCFLQSGVTEIDKQLIQAKKYLNEFVSLHAMNLFQQLTNSNKLDEIKPENLKKVSLKNYHLLIELLINDFQCRNSINEFISHSTSLYYLNIIKQFPLIKPLISLIFSCGTNLANIVTGRLEAADVIFNEAHRSKFEQFCSFMSESYTKQVFTALVKQIQKKLAMNNNVQNVLTVLEIGAGNGAATLIALDVLLEFTNSTGTIIEYTLTDISAEVLNDARKILTSYITQRNTKDLLRLTYEVYDINKSPEHYQFESFNIIFASHVIHIAENIAQTLSNLRQLLTSNGLMIVLESTHSILYLNMIYGLLSQSWNTSLDKKSRLNSSPSMLKIEEWQSAFKLASGYREIDYVCSETGVTTIIAQKLVDVTQEKLWIIFCDANQQSVGCEIAIKLQQCYGVQNIELLSYQKELMCASYFHTIVIKDIVIDIRRFLEDTASSFPTVDIVYCWPLNFGFEDINEHIVHDKVEIVCGALSSIFQTMAVFSKRSRIFVLTQNGQIGQQNTDVNPIQCSVIGFTRTARREYTNYRCKLIDLMSRSSILIDELINEIHSRSEVIGIEEETILQLDASCLVERWKPVYKKFNQNEILKQSQKQEPTTKIAMFGQACDTIPYKLEDSQFHSPLHSSQVFFSSTFILPPNSVEVKVDCISVNYRDLPIVQDVYASSSTANFEHELKDKKLRTNFCGTVTNLGERVSFLKIGDRVLSISNNIDCSTSYVIVDEIEVVRAPHNLTMEQLCRIGIPFLTVVHALQKCANLECNQSVLIHKASTDIGLAAIEYCKFIGAHIIATDDTVQNRDYLMNTFNFKHVLNCSDLSFVAHTRQLAPNGVHVVLNTLSEVFLEESIKLLSPYGHFIELNPNFDHVLFYVTNPISFHVINLVEYHRIYPKIVTALLKEISDMVEEKQIRLVKPVTVFQSSQTEEIAKLYNDTNFIGPVIMKTSTTIDDLSVNTSINAVLKTKKSNALFCSNFVCNHGTIMISGGLGGLGMEMSKWMIKNKHVKRIVLLSRRNMDELKLSNTQEENWKDLEQTALQYDAHVEIAKVDVTKQDQVFKIFERINRSSFPVRGIIHMAMVLHDCLVENLTLDILSEVTGPKVRGAWFLHSVSLMTKSPIEFFIMFSSVRNHLNDIGSSGYNVGNNFLDGLAHYRSQKNLPALSISVPGILDVGYIQRNHGLLVDSITEEGSELLPACYLFELIEVFHSNENTIPTPVIFAVNWNKLLLKCEAYSSKLQNLIKEQVSNAVSNEKKVQSLKADKLTISDIEMIKNDIRSIVAKLFDSNDSEKIETNKSLISQGLDSLRAVSLYNRLYNKYALQMSITDILYGISINEITYKIHQQWQLTHKSSSNDSTTGVDSPNNTDTSTASYKNSTNVMDAGAIELYTGTSLLIRLGVHNSAKPNIFCIPDILGLGDRTFSRYDEKLKSHFTLISFRSSGYAENESTLTSVEQIADEYIHQMKRYQPYEPYILFGYSLFGCLIAYEMIYQLTLYHKNISVQYLILLNSNDELQWNVQSYISKPSTIMHLCIIYKPQINQNSIYNSLLVRFKSQSYLYLKTTTNEIMENISEILNTSNSNDILLRYIYKVGDKNTFLKKVYNVIENNLKALNEYILRVINNSESNIQLDTHIIHTSKVRALINDEQFNNVVDDTQPLFPNKNKQTDYYFEEEVDEENVPNVIIHKLNIVDLTQDAATKRTEDVLSWHAPSTDIFRMKNEISRQVNDGTNEQTQWVSLNIEQGFASYAQERIWLDEQMRFKNSQNQTVNREIYTTTAYNVLSLFKTDRKCGPISIKRLLHALNLVIEKHTPLRTRFQYDGEINCLKQSFVSSEEDFYTLQLIEICKRNVDEEIERLLDEYMQRQWFNLEDGILVKCCLIRTDQPWQQCDLNDLFTHDLYILCIFHHITFDHFSINIFLNDFKKAYQTETHLDPLPLQYIDYSQYERQLNMIDAQQYWWHLLNDYGIRNQLKLPYDRISIQHAYNNNYSSDGSYVGINFDSNLMYKLFNYASKTNTTIYQLMLTVYYVFLYKLVQQEDFCIATLNANRYRPELQSLIGMFVNILPIRFRLNPLSESFYKLLLDVKQLCLNTFQYSYLPYQEIIKSQKRVNSTKSYCPLPFVQTVFSLSTQSIKEYIDLDEHITLLHQANLFRHQEYNSPGFTKPKKITPMFDFDFSILYNPDIPNMSFEIEYSTDSFHPQTLVDISERFLIFIERLAATFDQEQQQPASQLTITLPKELIILSSPKHDIVSLADEIEAYPQCKETNITPKISVTKGMIDVEYLANQLWCQVLWQKQIKENTNFFGLGGTSLLLILLCRLYENTFHINPSILTISEFWYKSTLDDHIDLLIKYIAQQCVDDIIREIE
ncbi:unnamed protein product [Adineta ricciae]|uniref:Uncharacterized protein n=1 Tax=Adineta ricciae TaxID=249248 RepID=A0A815SK54_ADIRI|nr:unnamed protein product [Adineta ricciae]